MLKRIIAGSIALFLMISPLVSAESEPTSVGVSPPIREQTWHYLNEHAPGEWSMVAYAMGGKMIRDDVKMSLEAKLNTGMYSGFSSITVFENAILSLIKLEENPSLYQSHDFITLLSKDEFLYHEGLDGASMALWIYESAEHYDIYVPQTSRNSVPSVIEHIVSLQQADGGFSTRTGGRADVAVTARAAISLAAYDGIPYAKEPLEKAISWLSSQQNGDGTYSRQDSLPDCATTAAVLSAIRTCGIKATDERFVKNGNTLTQALDLFVTPSGGYRPTPGTEPTVAATEQAVIAAYADFYGLSPYLPPAAYPGYISPDAADKQEDFNSVWFLLKFILMLTLVYLLLMLTIRIGKFAEKRKLPGSLAADQQKKDDEAAAARRLETGTFELHIPMNAELPDFDALDENDTGLSHGDSKQ